MYVSDLGSREVVLKRDFAEILSAIKWHKVKIQKKVELTRR
jgi:hypothetical protein